MLRRWYVALPILLATLFLAVITSGTVNRTYSASTSMIMLGPSKDTFTDDKGVQRTVAVNPYFSLPGSATTIATTLAIRNSSNSVRQKVAEAGLSPGYDISVGKTPLVDITVETTSPEKALKTVEYLASLLKADLQSQQDDFGVDKITRLNFQTVVPPDSLPVATSSTVTRVRMTIVGFGTVLAIALSLAVEGLVEVLRVRRGRKAIAAASAAAAGAADGIVAMTPPGVSAGARHTNGS
jgi:capsular polysaccharide biosynthesis protein